ncbi:hypothetical protein GCM10008018_35820 [Paenibacillus marchantiophytorum]|uniref:Uncharacterized protein n=1 Tax=Paenibacillus marchantiophytorum TaxID=1619310 RepID=A0ABQ1EUI7_9BACL|nr:hypothetical protein GCM10008018_35820 [Paenibacillus marchantiophytorum]
MYTLSSFTYSGRAAEPRRRPGTIILSPLMNWMMLIDEKMATLAI